MLSKNTDKQKYKELTDELMFTLGYFKLNKGREESHSDSPTITKNRNWVKMLSYFWKRNHKYEDGKFKFRYITQEEILDYINNEN